MNNLIQNYKIILENLELNCKNNTSFTQIRQPKLSNLELVALNFTAEYMSISTELQLFRKLKGTILEHKIERSVYNKRKRKLLDYMETIRKVLLSKFDNTSQLFIIDSKPLEICEFARANRSKICSSPSVKPFFGYNAAKKKRYFGYKLHAVCNENGVINSFDFTPANVHDIHYLKEVKHNFSDCEIIGDKGYISADYQLDLFSFSQIKLSVPMRKNQHNFKKFPFDKSLKRKRIETVFSQLDGQFTMATNYAKTLVGFKTRILSKITTFTMIQYLNVFVFKRSINKTKINLC